MSAQDEREALTSSPALYDRARRLLRESPDRLPPERDYHFPTLPGSDGSEEPDEPVLTRAAAEAAVRAALTPLPSDVATLHHRLVHLVLPKRQLWVIRSAVQALPLPGADQEAARALARELVRTGTTVTAVSVGIALLGRVGEPKDEPPLSLLGVFPSSPGSQWQPSTGSTARALPQPGSPRPAIGRSCVR